MEKPNAALDWRPATPEDDPFVLDLTYQTMQDYLTVSHSSTTEELRVWLKTRNAGFRWFVAFLEGKPVGALAFSRLRDRINIDSIHVLPEWQNQGLGTETLRRMQQWADTQMLPLTLQVMKHNSAAKRFYERLGFTVFAEDDRIYQLWRPFMSSQVS